MTIATARTFRQGDEVSIKGIPAVILNMPANGQVLVDGKMENVLIFNTLNILGEIEEMNSLEVESV